MNHARIVLASCAALILTGSAGLAQQATTGSGMVTIVDRINGTVAIRPVQDRAGGANSGGTVGTNSGGAATAFKVKGVSLDNLHAGDMVKYSTTEADGAPTITRIEKQ